MRMMFFGRWKGSAKQRYVADPREGVRNGITEGVISKQLLWFFFPILFGTFFQQMYNTADAVIVGHFVGKEALAAVGGATGNLINLMVGIFVGISSGAAVIISQFYGARDEQGVGRAVHTALAFSLIAGGVLMIAGVLISPLALRRMGTPSSVIGYAKLYIQIYFLGIIPNLIYNMGTGILRAAGDSKRPLYFLIISCFINIGLDILFVVFLCWSVAGAALATILSQLISAVFVMAVLARTTDMYRLVLRKLRVNGRMLGKIVKIGFPTSLEAIFYSVSTVIIQTGINSLGTNTVAAWAAYEKIDNFYWMVSTALATSITTFVAQNYGAGKHDRVKRGIRVCLIMSFLITISLSVILFLGGKYVLMLFTSDEAVLGTGMVILHFLVPTWVTYVFIEIYTGALRGVGDTWPPMIITAVGICLLRAVWVMAAVPVRPDVITVIFCYPLSWVITSVLIIGYFMGFSKLKRKRE